MSDEPSRILIIRPSALGDVCRTVPALVSLRRAFPNARIDWLVQDAFAPAIAHHPDLSGVVPFARTTLGSSILRASYARPLRYLVSLRDAHYDLVIDLQGLARSGLFAWATHAPRRVGYANAREFGWLGLNERHRISWTLHAVDRMLALVRAAGIEPSPDLRLYAPPAERQTLSRDVALADKRCVLVAPTSRWPGKRWPADRFAALCRTLLEGRAPVDAIVLVGAPSERDQCGPLLALAAEDPRIIDRIGATSIGGLMALVERSALVIANDSAALHMAVGFGRPLIGLYGPTRVDLVGPYGHERDVIQHVGPLDRLDHKVESLGRALMGRIGVEEVLARAVDRLGTARPA